MSTLVVDRRKADIEDDGDRLVVRVAGERIGTVPLAPLDRVILPASARIGTRLLARLWRDGIGVLILSGRRRLPTVALQSRKAGDWRLQQAQLRALDDASFRDAVGRDLVGAKLAGQARILAELDDSVKAVRSARLRLDAAMTQIGRALPPRHSLLGIEGAAAAAYFAALAATLPAALDFSGRNRRPPKDPVNVCLSLGYTLLHAEATRTAAAHGLDPELGLYHEPRPGRASLASDLIEPLRPALDRWAIGQFRGGSLRAEHFSKRGSSCLMGKAGRKLYYRGFEDAAPPWRRLLRRMAHRLAGELRRRQDSCQPAAIAPSARQRALPGPSSRTKQEHGS